MEELMVQIGDTLVSLDLFEREFICDLPKCKGACCEIGDAGAPLEEEEAEMLQQIFLSIKPYLKKLGKKAIEKQGAYVIDDDGEKVTPLINDKECAYSVKEKGILYCGIEKAYKEGKTHFRKPVSCHLYPVRLQKYKEFTAVNYHKWDICQPARLLGAKEGVPVYKFLKDALVRKFGEEWYRELESVGEALNNHKPFLKMSLKNTR